MLLGVVALNAGKKIQYDGANMKITQRAGLRRAAEAQISRRLGIEPRSIRLCTPTGAPYVISTMPLRVMSGRRMHLTRISMIPLRPGERVGGGTDLAGGQAGLAQRAEDSPGRPGRAGLGDARGPRRRLRRPRRRPCLHAVEQQHRYLDGGDAVDQRVVGLADDRPATAGETVICASRQSGRSMSSGRPSSLPRKLAQLACAAGCGQRHAVHVARDVEACVVDPLLAVHAAAEARQRVEAGIYVVPQAGDGGSGTVELQRPADVQGRLSGLEVKERRVECAEAVWWRHACKKSAGKRIAKGSWLRAEETKRGRPWVRSRWSSSSVCCLAVAITHFGLVLPFRRGPGVRNRDTPRARQGKRRVGLAGLMRCLLLRVLKAYICLGMHPQ